MKVLGLDLSSKTIGWSVIQKSDLLDFGIISLDKYKKVKFPLEYVQVAYSAILKVVIDTIPDLCIIEATFLRNPKTLKSLCRIRGIAEIACINGGLKAIEEVYASSARKRVFGNGALKKDEIYTQLSKTYGNQIFNDGYDVSDSIVLALYGGKFNVA